MKSICLLAAGLLAVSPLFAQELTEETFGKWYSYILPKEKDLAWRKIPWRGTLWEAVLEAGKKDMPVLFWAMNGHPLDCT
jgi:hypothetical protein